MTDTTIDSRDITREIIRAVTSSAELQKIIDTLDDAINTIKAQLEFRTDDHADADWERRAIGALGMHQSHYNEAMRQMHRLTGRRDANVEQAERDRLAKAIEKQNAIKERELALERQKLNAEKSRIITVERAIKTLNTARFHRNFYRLAQATLPPETLNGLLSAADKQTEKLTADVLMEMGLGQLVNAAVPAPEEARNADAT